MEMTIKEAHVYFDNHPELFFSKAKKSGWVCPLCDNGTGTNGTGLGVIDGNKYTCFRCGDITKQPIINIIALKHGIDQNDYVGKVKKAAELAGVTIIDDYQYQNKRESKVMDKDKIDLKIKEIIKNDIVDAAKNFDYRVVDYLKTRGISVDTALKFGLGYFDNWVHPKRRVYGYTDDAREVLLIPCGDDSYSVRNLNPNCEKSEKHSKAGTVDALFNEKVLVKAAKNDEYVFVCEGEIDAMSFAEVGFNAVALRSTSNTDKLIQFITEHKLILRQPLLLALDADSAGAKATNSLVEKLAVAKIDYRVVDKNIYTIKKYNGDVVEFKDANEFLVKNKSEFVSNCSLAINPSLAAAKLFDSNFLQAYDEIQSTLEPPIPTGLKDLDDALNGGLFAGVYYLGGLPALGKTAVVHQIGDNIASRGDVKVVYFSLEMSKKELWDRAISRRTFTQNDKYGMTALEVSNKANWSSKIINDSFYIDNMSRAKADYANTAARSLATIENETTQRTIDEIDAEFEKIYKFLPKNRFVIIIDYLQILGNPFERSVTDKQIVDYNVLSLKKMSRKYKAPILCISNLNRENYLNEISLNAFKESGSIEYGADCVIGLQVYGISKFKDNSKKREIRDFIDNALESVPRTVEMKILKNRKGMTSSRIIFDYFPQFNTYKDNPVLTSRVRDERRKAREEAEKQQKLEDSFKYSQNDSTDEQSTPAQVPLNISID